MNEPQDTIANELPHALHVAVAQVLAEPIGAPDIERALAPLRRTEPSVAVRRSLTRRRAFAIAGLAASLLAGIFLVQLGSRSAWADVVEAVAGRPWVHGSGKTSEGEAVEFWYSGPRQIMASRTGDRLLFHDGENEVMETYDGGGPQPAINRLEISAGNRDRAAMFQALLEGKFEKFVSSVGAEIIENSERKVTVDGQPRQSFRFVMAEPGSDIRTTVTLLVDPTSKLPTRWETKTTGLDGGEKHSLACTLNYPESGPETIYALGAPRSAPIADNVPRGDLKRIVTGLRQGRARFDNYRGIAVTGSQTPFPDGSGPAICYQVWRKGLKWRIEMCQLKGTDRLPADVDPQAWWNTQVANSRLILQSLSDGKRHCKLKPVPVQPPQSDPENPRYLKIASFTKDVRPIYEPSDPWPSYNPQEMPEIVSHPPLLGENSAHYEMSVDPAPAGGPAGCVLVESLRRDSQQRPMVGRRSWIDPTRGYLVLFEETLSGTRDNPQVRQATDILDVAQSPSGRWYPTLLRVIGGSVALETGAKSDYFNVYYLDFDAEIPDALFEIPE